MFFWYLYNIVFSLLLYFYDILFLIPLGEILVYLLPLSVTDTISFARFGIGGMEEEIENWGTELNKIEV